MGAAVVLYWCPAWLPDRWWKPLVRDGFTVEDNTEQEVQRIIERDKEDRSRLLMRFSPDELLRHMRYGTVRSEEGTTKVTFWHDVDRERDSWVAWWLSV